MTAAGPRSRSSGPRSARHPRRPSDTRGTRLEPARVPRVSDGRRGCLAERGPDDLLRGPAAVISLHRRNPHPCKEANLMNRYAPQALAVSLVVVSAAFAAFVRAAPPSAAAVTFDEDKNGAASKSFEGVIGDWYVAEADGKRGLMVDGTRW